MVQQLWSGPDIFCIPVPLPDNPLKNLNVYVVRSGGEALVIDTGFNRPECREALLAGLRELGVDLNRTFLFLTHLHSDHTGLVWDFIHGGSRVYMNAIDHEVCCRGTRERWGGLEDLYRSEGFPQEIIDRQQTENQGRAYGPKVPFPIVPIHHGSRLRLGSCEFLCIHTPGHTPGHTVLYLPEQRLLFSGDHVLFHITPNISMWDGVEDPLEDYLNSLKMLRDLPVERVFPAHRQLEGDFYQRLEELRLHHEARLEELYAAARDNPGADGYTLAGCLHWSARGLGWEAFPPHQKWFAMGETLSHLRRLEHMGRIARTEHSGTYRYYIMK